MIEPRGGHAGGLQPAALTTPDAITLQSQLADLIKQGADSVCLEVSSHAIDQGRIEGIEFNSALFTNLSRDHLDYHQTMERYAETKLLLFRRKELESIIINVDSVGRAFASQEFRRCGPMVRMTGHVFPVKVDVGSGSVTLYLHAPLGNSVYLWK